MVAGFVDTTLTGALALPGNFKFSALGMMSDEVSMKKINNRNIMSVKEDMLNCALTLFFFFKPKLLVFSRLSSNYCSHS